MQVFLVKMFQNIQESILGYKTDEILSLLRFIFSRKENIFLGQIYAIFI